MMENNVEECCNDTTCNTIATKKSDDIETVAVDSPLPNHCEGDVPAISTPEVAVMQTNCCSLDQKPVMSNPHVPSSDFHSIVNESDALNQLVPDTNSTYSSDAADSHQTIMSACSTVGQHIRQDITDALNLRAAETPSASASDVTSLLQAAVIEKLENFETTVMEKLSETVAEAFDKHFSGEMNDEAQLLNSETETVGKSITEENSTEKLICNDRPVSASCKKSLTSDICEGDLSSSEQMQINSPVNDSVHSSVDSVMQNHDTQRRDSNASDSDISHNAIKSICSTFGQHIHDTLAETLNSGVVQESVLPTSYNNLVSLLEIAVIRKLENFENSIMQKLSTVVSRSNVQGEIEETSSLSGEADTGDKDPLEESNTEQISAASMQNVDETDNKLSVPDSGAIREKSKKSQRNTTNKKKGEKTIGFFTNQIQKSLSGYTSEEEKLSVLCRKHAETLDKLKSTEIQLKQSERQVVQISREKEQLQADHNRNVLAKSRLESLCRELQRQNKAVKEESLLRIREEEEKRKEVASKFQTTLNEISSLMQENSKKNLQLKEENAELAQKLKTLVEHYEMWEKHMEKVVQQKDLEAQLAKAKHAKTNLQLKQETENFLREKQTLLENMSELQKKCTQLASNELQLRAELSDYTSKYEEFQTVLNKSNQVFASFKTDMDTTSKKIKKLEKETNIWKQKWESSNNALLEMVADKQARDKELKNAQQRILTLEKLCRALQAERNDLQNQIKEKLIEQNCNASAEEGTQAC